MCACFNGTRDTNTIPLHNWLDIGVTEKLRFQRSHRNETSVVIDKHLHFDRFSVDRWQKRIKKVRVFKQKPISVDGPNIYTLSPDLFTPGSKCSTMKQKPTATGN